MIRVLVVDDHRLVRAGLIALLHAGDGLSTSTSSSSDDIEVVGEAADGAEAVQRAGELAPDVVLMDLSMPVMDGVTATAAVLAAVPDTAVVVLTSFIDQAQVRQALAAGAVGYLLKDSEPREVLSAVRSAAAGHAPLDPRVARALLPGSPTSPPPPLSPGQSPQPQHPVQPQQPATGLSGREHEVLQLIAEGLANKQIARSLGISEHTVKVHVGRILRQLGVSGRTAAAVWAREHLPPSGTS
ncbi:response regulator [Kineococcus radiotolerans]|uniref:Two component transcriptional regulator, LuxR family n=1 Tax=Kineococcus radiotolerans (strain ATCC BAA-149 / DSM 14245 / SRS30216) TaxID=266940 RepID=A6WGQ0_KINRD|nr:response regulator transcription factor [Kineococcus radiotolerans]ABS05989.1 two component transcriptional regulator, LuxR family [Kineococcus radiotolerans SRS30216 = ATCC BAA-149]